MSSTSTNAAAGRLEIYLQGEWGTVCERGFDSTEATVACRQLGYSTVLQYGSVGSLGYIPLCWNVYFLLMGNLWFVFAGSFNVNL